MKRGASILLLGLLACLITFLCVYYSCTVAHRQMLREAAPELAWLKREFNLSDAEFSRIANLHSAYLPQCQMRCRTIEIQNEKLHQLLATNTAVTPEIESLLAERAKTRAECQSAMLNHFLMVSRAMPPAEGERYLAWVKAQTFARDEAIESHHYQ